jgi:hypothetical protein
VAIPDLRGKSEAAVMEYYGGIPRCARIMRLDGNHKNDPETGKSVPLEAVETSPFNLAMNIV